MSLSRTSTLLLLPPLLLALGAWAKLPLPPYVRACSWQFSDKKMSECGLSRSAEVLPQVLQGDPKYNVPVLEPLHIDSLTVIEGKGPLGMQLIATNVSLHGLNKMRVQNVVHRKALQDCTYEAIIPDILINAKYNISGRILLLPVVGTGNAVMTMKNLRLVFQFDWKLQKLQDGEVYYVPQPGSRLEIDTEKMTVHLDNLFNGDKTILEATNNFLNEDWREVFESLKPNFAKAIAEVVNGIFHGIFTQVPFKDAFTDVTEEDIQKAVPA